MAITQITIQSPVNEILFTDTAMGNIVDAVKGSSAKVFSVFVDNSLNGAASYVKLFNAAGGGVTLGTTVPDEVLYIPANAIIPIFFFTSANPGKTFASALSAACVTTGGTAGTTSPTSSVVVTINYV
jgi:hypothetical protein